MSKLTEAQQRYLASVAAGTVFREFDVYGGYRWIEQNYSTAWRKSDWNAPRPISGLMEVGLIALGETRRPHSGRRITQYVVSPAGLALLKALERKDG